MTLLSDIGMAVRGAIGGDVFPAGTLHAATDGVTDAGETVAMFTDHATTGFVASWRQGEAPARGYPENSVKIVLVQGDYPAPKIGDQVTATRPIVGTTARYRVLGASSDPADATWTIGGEPI